MAEDTSSSALPSGDQDPQISEAPEEHVEEPLEADLKPPAPTTSMAPVDGINLDGANDAHPPPDMAMPTLETRIPAKKDATLREFLGKMDEYAPIIPDAVTNYYLTLAGLPPAPQTSPHLARLLALATQKFIADIAADAYQYSRIRSTNTTSNNPLTGLGGAAGFGVGGDGGGNEGGGGGGGGGKAGAKSKESKGPTLGGPRAGFGGGGGAGGASGRTVLTMEDLGMAVGEYGVNVKRGEFYR